MYIDKGNNINLSATNTVLTGNLKVADAGTIGTATTAAAITLAANGTATFSAGIDVTAAAGITLENDETITNSTNGTVLINGGILATGAGNADATIASNGDYNLILQTGNSTTGSITITDGANGDITLAPNGSGTVVASALAKVSNTANDAVGGILTLSNERGTNNGADDDGSGNVALLEIAEAFQLASEAGQRPKRSITAQTCSLETVLSMRSLHRASERSRE